MLWNNQLLHLGMVFSVHKSDSVLPYLMPLWLPLVVQVTLELATLSFQSHSVPLLSLSCFSQVGLAWNESKPMDSKHIWFLWFFTASFPDLSLSLVQVSAWPMHQPHALYCHRAQVFPPVAPITCAVTRVPRTETGSKCPLP